MIQKELIDILACPACDQRPPVRLSDDGQFLVCINCGLRYPIRDDIPIMLVDQALPAETEAAPISEQDDCNDGGRARLRFAPSPTGNVHIGNIRAAIFNWLYARHVGGSFLLRIEDTDRERSTDEAIANLLEVMEWMGLDCDEAPLYQSTRRQAHLAAAEQLLKQGRAYRDAKGGGGEAVVFRIPWDAEKVPGVETTGSVQLEIHPDEPVKIDRTGIGYALVSKKGKPVPQNSCLAGMKDMEVLDADGAVVFTLDDAQAIKIIDGGDSVMIENAVKIRFTRRSIKFDDLVKGALAKPLDSMRDVVIVRSDGSPVFHLANVCDDIHQNITHIVRGDDHVENTYRHLFIFHALDAEPPRYGHLPMIVNDQGKPYSKRDGDAYVGEFRDKGYLADALFNYLTLLGWSPGDDREKLNKHELIEAFSLERVQQSAAKMDFAKLDNLNSRYLAEMDADEFVGVCRKYVEKTSFAEMIDDEYFAKIAALLQSRTKKFTDVADWDYFFVEIPEYDEKAVRKFIDKPGIPEALGEVRKNLEASADFDAPTLEQVILETTEACGIKPGKLNQPLRVAVTGRTVGAGVYETLAALGRETTLKRLDHALAALPHRSPAAPDTN